MSYFIYLVPSMHLAFFQVHTPRQKWDCRLPDIRVNVNFLSLVTPLTRVGWTVGETLNFGTNFQTLKVIQLWHHLLREVVASVPLEKLKQRQETICQICLSCSLHHRSYTEQKIRLVVIHVPSDFLILPSGGMLCKISAECSFFPPSG